MNTRSPIPKESKDMNSALPHHPIPANLKSKLAKISATISSALRFSLITLAGCLVMTQTGLGQTPYILSSGNKTWNFSDIANWTNNFASGIDAANWSSVAIIGSGTSVTTGTRTTKSSATFATGTTGGLQKGTGAMLFLSTSSTSTPEAVAVDLLLDFTGRTAGTLSFDWACVFNSTGDRGGSLDTYTSLDGAIWTKLGSTISVVNNVVSSGSTATIALPESFSGSSTAKIRFYQYANTVGTTGSRPKISIDNVAVTSTASGLPPTIIGAATTGVFTTTYGTSSTPQIFDISGTNLTAPLVAIAPTGFEVSADGTTYGGTASFTQTGGSASGSLRVRLGATAAVNGTYNSQTITLSSTNATSANITTAASGNIVTAKPLSITAAPQNKFYGSELSLGASSFTSDGLVNSETIGAVTLNSAGSAAAASVGSYPITPSNATGGTFSASNYNITYNTGTLTVNPKPLTITANAITKPLGETLASPITGSTAFTSDGLIGTESIGSVTITYGTGAASSDAAGTYADQVVPSLAVGGTFNMSNYTPTYVPASLTVTAGPTITINGTLSAADTIYGTASSSPSSFTLSGIFLTGDLTVTPPAGFEVSTNLGSGYTTSLTLPAGGNLNSTTVYLRLAATTAFGTYAGNITVSGGGAASKTIATTSSSVAKKGLSITGLTGNNKAYDRTAAATTSGNASYVGLENGDVFAVTGTPTASFADANAAPAKPITITGYTAPSDNYSVSQPLGLSADITTLALTVTGSTVTNRPYNGENVATITGSTLIGVINPDVVTIATSTGTFADANAGTSISVTANLTLGGTNAGNYRIIQPTGLTGDITKVSQFINFSAPPDKLTTDPSFVLSATGGASGQPVTFVADPPSSVIIITGNDVTIVGAGTATITASQAGDANYNAAQNVIRTLTVIEPPLANWTGPWSGIAASPLTATTQKTNLAIASIARVGLTGGSSTSRYSSSAWNTTANYMTVTLTAASGYLVNLNGTTVTGTWGSSNTGPASFEVRSSVDNFATSIGTFNSSASSATTSITLPSTNFNNLSTVTFRFIGSATAANGSTTASGGTGGPSSLVFNGEVIIAPSITGAATTTAFTTTYGAPSAEQSFPVSGASLTADLTATAPSGFEVSSDGITYAATATFPQSSGTASGSLRIRLAATAPVSGIYNSQDIILTSTAATPVNIVTASSGNLVSKAASTITSSPTASSIVSGQTLASSTLSGGSASVAGGFTFTSPSTAPSIGTSTHGVTFTPTDASNYNTASTTVSVTVTSAYATWSGNFLPGFTDTATTSNPDNDGLSNLLEFAFGTNPTVSNSSPITHANGIITTNGQPTTSVTNTANGVDYRAVFGRRKDYLAAGLTYTVQFSAGLDVWVDSTDTPTVVASDATMDAVTVPYPLFITTTRGVEKPTFFRVAVSSN